MRLAVGAARVAPPRFARTLISAAAWRIARDRGSSLARASRINQYVASGCTLTGDALDAAVAENIRAMILFLYDFYRVLGNDAAEDAAVVRDDAFYAFIERDRTEGPFVYVGAHMGNFDLVGRLFGRNGWHMQALSVPDPSGSYQWQNELRGQVGFELTPVSMTSLKTAARRLASGFSVVTGVDRPMPEPDKVQPRFFGRPAPLPLLHVRLAMRAGVPVVPMAGHRRPDGRYEFLAADPIPMVGDRPTPDVLRANAEAVLAPVERWITDDPAQWSMPHVVWPDVEAP